MVLCLLAMPIQAWLSSFPQLNLKPLLALSTAAFRWPFEDQLGEADYQLYKDIIVIALLLAITLGKLLNSIIAALDNQCGLGIASKFYTRVIADIGTDLDRLILRVYENTKPISITMKNNKVYIGYVMLGQLPVGSEQITLLPLLSGYRDKDTKDLYLTQNYSSIYEDLLAATNDEQLRRQEDHARQLADQLNHDFQIILPIQELQSVSMFDLQIYQQKQMVLLPTKPPCQASASDQTTIGNATAALLR